MTRLLLAMMFLPAGRLQRVEAQPSGSFRNKGTTVASGEKGAVSWRLNVWDEDGDTCLGFHTRNRLSGGGAATCEQEPPIGVSVSSSTDGRYAYGLTSGRVTQVRFEYADGSAATTTTVTSPGFSERFYAHEVSRVPFRRIVALDAGGRVIAEYEDVSALNTRA